MRRGLESRFFESCSVNGDKIIINKCVIDKAIKDIKNDPDPFLDSERTAGRTDILEDMLDVIQRYKIKNGDKRNKV